MLTEEEIKEIRIMEGQMKNYIRGLIDQEIYDEKEIVSMVREKFDYPDYNVYIYDMIYHIKLEIN